MNWFSNCSPFTMYRSLFFPMRYALCALPSLSFKSLPSVRLNFLEGTLFNLDSEWQWFAVAGHCLGFSNVFCYQITYFPGGATHTPGIHAFKVTFYHFLDSFFNLPPSILFAEVIQKHGQGGDGC